MTNEWERAPTFGAPVEGAPRVVRPSAYALIGDGAGRVALVRAKSGLFLPGGGVEHGETIEQAIVREVREECALAVRLGPWRAHAIQHAWSRAERTSFEKRSTFASAELMGPWAMRTPPEHELVWHAIESAASKLGPASHAWAVERWIEELRP